MGKAVLLLVAILPFLGGCAALTQGDRHERMHWFPRYHTVQEGDTLYSIAWRYGYDYPKVAEWNEIQPPYTIKVGDRLRIAPPSTLDTRTTRLGRGSGAGGELRARRRTESAPESPTARRSPAPVSSSPPRSSARPSPAVQAAQRAASAGPSNVSWAWPVEGEVIRDFPVDGSGKRGIAISGSRGDPVKAAAGGRVVYAGSGLIGYGELIIIKHDHIFLSAYAHNQRLLVGEGDQVEKGEAIAEMGDTGTDRVMLHFEIRRDGQPVDPIRHLPDR